jgi:hypothetical protein
MVPSVSAPVIENWETAKLELVHVSRPFKQTRVELVQQDEVYH